VPEGPGTRGAGAADAAGLGRTLAEEVARVVVGKERQTRLLTVALLSEGHVLVDDVPGVAKTLLVRTLSAALGLAFARVQCTPDLLPADVTGSLVFDQKNGEFVFRPGPVFANIVLADEINRATPRTQAAFLEAMEEHGVTVDGVTHALPRPFFVLATQNPVELSGTFPLPEAQVDRFFLSLRMGYPSASDEELMLRRFRTGEPLSAVHRAVTADELAVARDQVRQVHVEPDVAAYVVALVRATRRSPLVRLGASPRASLALQRAAQAAAALDGRDFVVPDDVQGLAEAVLAHRLVLAREALMEGRSSADVLREAAATVPVPVEARDGRPSPP
jgi:MoxR-like ATPase